MPAPERVPAGGVNPGGGGRADGGEPVPADIELLTDGELTVEGRLREASNAVLFCRVSLRGRTATCVYKPVAGERPLWDFPDGTLAGRELAAYLVSEATGWGLVPPTVVREGPYGQGMVQLWIEVPGEDPGADGDKPADEAAGESAAGPGHGPAGEAAPVDGEESGEPADAVSSLLALVEPGQEPTGWKAVVEAETGDGRRVLLVHADDPALRRMAVLDAVINNADRKGGHLLPTSAGRIYGIDHGVTFHTDNKLRTLLWGWAGERLTDEATTVLRRLRGELSGALGERLSALLTVAETSALRDRVGSLLDVGVHPAPSGEWPAIPWPPV